MLNQAFIKGILDGYAANPANIDPRKWLALSRDGVKEVVRQKMRLFGSSGKATASGFVSPATSHRSAELGHLE